MERFARTALFFVLTAAGLLLASLPAVRSQSATEAPTGFTTTTGGSAQSVGNGFPVVSGDSYAQDQDEFEKPQGIDDGLGPVFNARACVDCHQNPVTGAGSQVTELRVGRRDAAGNFVAPSLTINNGQTTIPNRSLVNDRAICPEAQEVVPDLGRDSIRTFRMSLNVLGDGFIEAIDDATIKAIAAAQPGQSGGRIRGQVILVPVLEAPGQTRVARFGWKNQHASLLSFSADAYLNEIGVTSRFLMQDTTSLCKTTDDPEDETDEATGLTDIDRFTAFMRGSLAPPRDATAAASPDAIAGQALFSRVGCNICHVDTITTAPSGTVVNGGQFTIPDALASKIIHPFSDFLLHNVGTGDGIVQNGPPETANKMRTPPLWGLRTHDRLMHDGLSLTRSNAILRHQGEASGVVFRYRSLTSQQRQQLDAFLSSL
jgi:CxxC motif-containing protein (DUF1111 family)